MESTGTYLVYEIALTCIIFFQKLMPPFHAISRMFGSHTIPSHSNEFPTTPVNLSFNICLKHYY